MLTRSRIPALRLGLITVLVALLVSSLGCTGTSSAASSKHSDKSLAVSTTNPRWLSVGRGDAEQAVYLAGTNLWNNIQDGPGLATCDQPGPAFDWDAYLAFLESRHLNFARAWRWEHFQFKLPPEFDTGGPYCVDPHPWPRTGAGTAHDGEPKLDLASFDQAYFDRLRERVEDAGERGIYVSVMLFEGFCLHLCDDDTRIAGHPFDGQNNVNDIDIDSIEDYQSDTVPAPVLDLQRAYIRKVVDTVQDLDNVLYEVTNESWTGSVSWQYDVIDYVKQYETDKRYQQHPVGMSAIWPDGEQEWLFDSPADWVMPGTYPPPPDYRDDPPASDGTKVVISENDHYAPCDVDAVWAWKSLTRGLSSSQLDCGIADPAHPSPDFDFLEPARLAQGDARRQADKMDLLAMEPRGDLTSTGYALADPGHEYLVLQPEDEATLTVSLPPGVYKVRWFDVNGREWQSAPKITADTTTTTFTSPFATPGPTVLYLELKPSRSFRRSFGPSTGPNERRNEKGVSGLGVPPGSVG